jgi:hypothetical protein
MDASDIFQVYLDMVSHAVMTDDWDTYRGTVHLPCHIVSHDESKVVETVKDLRAGFDQFSQTLRFHRVTDYIRLVEAASQLDADLISGSYVTHLVAGGQRIMPPFRSQMTLRRVGGLWRAVSVTNALANSRWPLVRLALHPDTNPEGPKE